MMHRRAFLKEKFWWTGPVFTLKKEGGGEGQRGITYKEK